MYRWIELFLALRFLRPSRNYVSVITILSLLGVFFGVMVLIVVLSVMDGFQKELTRKVVGFNAHLTMVSSKGLMYDQDEKLNWVKVQEGVTGATPFITGEVLALHRDRISAPYIKGVDPESMDTVIPLKDKIIAGEGELYPGTVLVGKVWADRNNAWPGDKIQIYGPRHFAKARKAMRGEEQSFMMPEEFVINGIFNTDFNEYDAEFLIMGMNDAQYMYGLRDSVHGLAVKLDNPEKAIRVAREWRDHWAPTHDVLTWQELKPTLFRAVATERKVMAFVLFFVMIVAAFGLCSTLITVTVQKTKEIALMRALGASSQQVLSIFTLYGFVVGVVGSIGGVLGALVVLEYRNDFSNWLLVNFGTNVFPADIYHFTSIPAEVDLPTVFWIGLAGVTISTLAAFIPAWFASRIDPARIMQEN